MHVVRNRRILVLQNACVVLFHDKPTSNCKEAKKVTVTWKFIQRLCAG